MKESEEPLHTPDRGRVSCIAAPFGGVGHSGFGHSGGVEGIEEYLVTAT